MIQCETTAQLKDVKLLFGNCCLVGLWDTPPSVHNSVFYKVAYVTLLIPMTPLSIVFFWIHLDLVLIMSTMEFA